MTEIEGQANAVSPAQLLPEFLGSQFSLTQGVHWKLICPFFSEKKALLMQPISEEPPCPRCGNPFTVRLFTPMYAAKLATTPRAWSFNPFSLFTTHRARGSHRGSYALLDLIGGLVTAVVLIATSPFQQRRKVQHEKEQEQQRDTTRDGYQVIFQQCPPLYTCLTDHLVFTQGVQHTVPIDHVLRALNNGADTAALMQMVRG
jgi:hypothetical protein